MPAGGSTGRVQPALRQQCLVRALPRRMAVIQHVNIVRLCHVGKAVGNQDDRLAPGQPVDARHDVVLALYVDVGRCLVKNVDGTVMQQCAGQCQPLPLAAGQVAAALGQRGVQSVHRAQEVRQVHLLQRAPQRTVVCVGRGHPQIVGHRTFKEVVPRLTSVTFLSRLASLTAESSCPPMVTCPV